MPETRFAILIGINNYEGKPLHFCDKDVNKLQVTLERNCKFESGNIFPIVSTPEGPVEDIRADLVKAIKAIGDRITEEDALFFYFSGHGSLQDGTCLEFHEHKESLQSIFEMISELRAKNQIYVIDCCHAGYGIELKGGDENQTISELYNQRFAQKSDGVQMFCSCKHDETSKAIPRLDSSVYTYHFLEAIANASLYDQADQHLSLTLIHEYAVKKIVLEPDYKQTPFSFVKLSGFYPFAFQTEQSALTTCKVVVQIEDKFLVSDFLQRNALKFPSRFSRDFEQFLSELIANLFDHNYARSVTIEIEQNLIRIFDDSPQSFDPFKAVPGTGMGIRVYQLFLAKYEGHVEMSYVPGKPNIISLKFDDYIFADGTPDPCHLQVQGGFFRNPAVLNRYNLDLDCSEIVVDITASTGNLSFNHMLVTEFLRRTEAKKPMLIIRMEPTDMVKPGVQNLVRQLYPNERIIVI